MSETSIKKRPGTARSIVTEFSGCDGINPTPGDHEDSDLLMVDLCLSPAKLKILTGSDNLQEVTSLEMCVDTRQNTLDNFGVSLPSLKQLKMSNSVILSVRDLGTSLSHLQVLWLARCGLYDLEGIPCLSSLKELYIAYNHISELIQLSMLEHLELLDLEGNSVNDLFQVWHLGHCKNLRSLTLEGNPVCVCSSPGASETDYSYRSAVRELIPQLSFLDEVPVEEDKPQCCRSTLKDWTLLKKTTKDCSNSNTLEYTDAGEEAAKRTMRDLCSTGNEVEVEEMGCLWSQLTVGGGAGSVFYGNPLEATRARRRKLTKKESQSDSKPDWMVQNSRSYTRPSTRLGSYIPEHTYDTEESSSQDRKDVFAELRSWRIEHNKRLLAIEEDRQPQVMKILHRDDKDDDDEEDYEGSCNNSFISDDVTKNEEEEEETVYRDTTSPDSSFQSPLPHVFHQESQQVSRLAFSSDCTMSPSPPPSAVALSGGRRVTQTRARRLKPHNAQICVSGQTEDIPVTNLGTLKTNSTLEPQSTKTVKTGSPQMLRIPQRPATSLGVSPLRTQWSEATSNGEPSDNQHKPVVRSKASGQLTPTRPQTARAALQRLPNRVVVPARGNGHLE